MSLSFKKGSYIPEGKKASASVSSPVFVKIRGDKKVGEEDTGITQLTKIFELEETASRKKVLKKSTLMNRVVYVKESRGMKMVRKFMTWKTNKESSGDYPAYVFNYTDFSPGRSEMLKREVRVSDSKKQIEEIFKAELEENVKAGWEKV